MWSSFTAPTTPMQGFAALYPSRQRAYAQAVEGIAPTPRATVMRDGSASLYRFMSPAAPNNEHPPVLLVPSLINRWYVLDLCDGSSVVQALVDAGYDVWCLDWGVANEEDRHLTWEQVIDRCARMARAVLRRTSASKLSVLGYCMGATVASIAVTRFADRLHRFVNLAGPIDFSHAGVLGDLVDARWFDADAVASCGNIAADQMQSGFIALDPRSPSRRWQTAAKKLSGDGSLDRWAALDTWAADNVPFPAAAYATYIGAIYQRNELCRGQHIVGATRVDLGAILCPVLTVVAERDIICPPAAATALNDLVGSADTETLTIPGGHVGAVVGGKAARVLYPALSRFFA